VTDDQKTRAIAEAKKQEAIFFGHVINIRYQGRIQPVDATH
jgi:hypothetical protein